MAARARVLSRNGGRCEVGAEGCFGAAHHVHHIRRRSQGGTDDDGNLLALCAWCHDYVHAHPAVSYGRGWLRRSGL